MKQRLLSLFFLMGTLNAFCQTSYDVSAYAYPQDTQSKDARYVERLSKLNNIIELPYNEIVRNCIDGYVGKRSNQVERMLGLSDFYFPMIEESLEKNGLPHELKYLAVIESALNPSIQSRARATGLWQFMLVTGKEYGLEINSLVDERCDPQKATDAACKYLKDMYRKYGDWTLAIASYNCGSGNVQKAIRRAGGKTDYWAIYPYLPKETRMYVPLFIAATYAMNYAGEHDLHAIAPEIPLDVDTIMVTTQIHFDQIAAVLNVDKEVIAMLNPQYKQEIIPGNSQPRVLKLPSHHAYAYIDQADDVYNHRRDEIFSNRTYAGDFGFGSHSSGELIKKYHKVKKGETLASISNKYGVSSKSVKKWNRLKSNKLKLGKSLVIYIEDFSEPAPAFKPTPTPAYLAQTTPTTTPAEVNVDMDATNEPVLNEAVMAELEAQLTNAVSSQVYADAYPTSSVQETNTKATKAKATTSSQSRTYKVKKGDSLYSIAAKFSGVSTQDLRQANKIKGSALKVGQTIRIPEV
ncbi:MAG: LysM peptidoglycan-binding domain-containing protein [Candidatus Symbiothrix sp.]|jgi:membrane-bound lytic murein transglycosylase D|nr:LysM peptidoglycan-binding domain-containing protein [Candidatus Symbiothrix sp.]